MWKNIRTIAMAIAPLAIAGFAPSLSAASNHSAPRGSVTVTTTSLTGAGQDYAQSVAQGTVKAFWDEIFDYPIAQDPNGDLAPALAESWKISDDLLTWAFDIRQGVKFHNGDTLTAEDVAWTWNRIMFGEESKHPLLGLGSHVESIVAEGNQVLIRTKSPQSLLPLWFAKIEGHKGGTVLSKKHVESVGIEQAMRSPIGTGPYKFVSFDGEQSVVLTAFDDPERSEWQKTRNAGFKNVTILAVPEPSTRVALLKTGGADMVPLSLTAVEDVKSTPGLRVVTASTTNYSGMWCIGFTLNPASPCNDQRVREALSIAIDRQTIADAVYLGTAEPSGGFFGGQGSFGYPKDLTPPPFDPDRARQLLAEAGFDEANPLVVNIQAPNEDGDFPMMPTLAEAIAGYYDAIGVQASITVNDWSAQKANAIEGTYPGARNNPEVFPLTMFLRGMDNRFYFPAEQIGAYTEDGPVGAGVWNDDNLPEQRERLDAVAAEFDLSKQERLFGDYYKWMAENYNHIPLLASGASFGVSSKVKDWQPWAGKPFIHELWSLVPADD